MPDEVDNYIEERALNEAEESPTDANEGTPPSQAVVPPVDDNASDVKEGEEGEADASKVSKFVPHERLNEVIAQRETERQRAEAAEAKATEIEQAKSYELANFRQEVKAAGAAGYSGVDLYREHNVWAAQNGYGNIESYQQYMTQVQEVDAELEQGTISDTAALRQKQQAYELATSRHLLNQTQGMVNGMLQRDVETEVSGIRSDIESHGAKVSSEFEAILKATPTKELKTVRASLNQMIKDAKESGKLEYAASKQKAEAGASPEGRGGNPPPPAKADDGSWKTRGWGSLILTGATKR